MSKKYTADALYSMLEKRYTAPAYALFPEVRNSTGFNRVRRSADAIVMSLWPSRGLTLMGFEIKVSRSDLVHELKMPEKADPISRYCDEWWLVSPGDIADVGELPPAWGWLVPRGARLATKKPAVPPEAEPISRGFLAALLRSASAEADRIREQYIPRSGVSEELKKEFRKGEERGLSQRVTVGKELGQLKKTVQRFEDAAGVLIHSWNGEQVGRAFRAAVLMEEAASENVQIRAAVQAFRTRANALENLIEEE